MKYYPRIVFLLAMILTTSKSAQAANVTFSDIIIEGSLAAGATFTTDTNGINFTLPNAKVGDGPHSMPLGSIIISFVAESTMPMNLDQLTLSMLSLGGAGAILFNETIFDIADPQAPMELVSFGTILNDPSATSFNTDLGFGTSSTRVLVVTTFTLTALDFDSSVSSYAEIGSVQQTFQLIPEPGTLALFLGGAALFICSTTRRRGSGY